LFQVILKNGNQKRQCKGKKINVQIYSGKYGSVNCEVDRIPVVERGQEVVWSSEKGNLGTCSDVIFDFSVGNEPKFKVKTPGSDNYCPKSVELKINNMYFCGEKNKSSHRKKYFYNSGDNYKKHDTIKERCS
jgi:hypothetical protein